MRGRGWSGPTVAPLPPSHGRPSPTVARLPLSHRRTAAPLPPSHGCPSPTVARPCDGGIVGCDGAHAAVVPLPDDRKDVRHAYAIKYMTGGFAIIASAKRGWRVIWSVEIRRANLRLGRKTRAPRCFSRRALRGPAVGRATPGWQHAYAGARPDETLTPLLPNALDGSAWLAETLAGGER